MPSKCNRKERQTRVAEEMGVSKMSSEYCDRHNMADHSDPISSPLCTHTDAKVKD